MLYLPWCIWEIGFRFLSVAFQLSNPMTISLLLVDQGIQGKPQKKVAFLVAWPIVMLQPMVPSKALKRFNNVFFKKDILRVREANHTLL